MAALVGYLSLCFLYGHFLLDCEQRKIATSTCRHVYIVHNILRAIFFCEFGLHAIFFFSSFFLSLLTPLLARKMSDDGNDIVELPQPHNAMAGTNLYVPFRIDLPAPFSGDNAEPFSLWIQRFEVALNVSATPPDKAKLLPAKLTGPAFAYWQSLSPAVKADYDLTKASLSAVFGHATFLATFQMYLNARPRKPQEPLEVYAAELTSLVTEAFPQYDVTARNCEIFRRFVTGLDPALQLKIHEHGAVTLDSALKIASQCKRAQLAISVANSTTIMPVTVHQQPSSATATPSNLMMTTAPRNAGALLMIALHLKKISVIRAVEAILPLPCVVSHTHHIIHVLINIAPIDTITHTLNQTAPPRESADPIWSMKTDHTPLARPHQLHITDSLVIAPTAHHHHPRITNSHHVLIHPLPAMYISLQSKEIQPLLHHIRETSRSCHLGPNVSSNTLNGPL